MDEVVTVGFKSDPLLHCHWTIWCNYL